MRYACEKDIRYCRVKSSDTKRTMKSMVIQYEVCNA